MHERFRFTHTINGREFFSDKAKEILMVTADNFSEDIKATTGNDHVNDFIEFGYFFCDIEQLASLCTNADHRHCFESHSQRVGNCHHFEKAALDQTSVPLA